MSTNETSILEEWNVDEKDFSSVVRENPSLRGMIIGYMAERKLIDYLRGIKGVGAKRETYP
jgi:hypothetical protein